MDWSNNLEKVKSCPSKFLIALKTLVSSQESPQAVKTMMCQMTTLLCSVPAPDLSARERTWKSAEGAAPAWRNAVLFNWAMPRGIWVLWLLLWPRGERWSHRCTGQVWAPLYVPLTVVLLWCQGRSVHHFWALYSYLAVVKSHFGRKNPLK